MTLYEYNRKMEEYKDKLSMLKYNERDKREELISEIGTFQTKYMDNVLKKYQETIDCSAREYIYELLSHAINISETGSSVIDVKTKEIAEEIDDIIWEEMGDYLLDCEIYEEGDHWVIDCLFSGNYVPYWDGWNEL